MSGYYGDPNEILAAVFKIIFKFWYYIHVLCGVCVKTFTFCQPFIKVPNS